MLAGISADAKLDDAINKIQETLGNHVNVQKHPLRDIVENFKRRVDQLNEEIVRLGGEAVDYDIDLSSESAHQILMALLRDRTKTYELLKQEKEGEAVADKPIKQPREGRHDGNGAEAEGKPLKLPRENKKKPKPKLRKRKYVKPPPPGKAANKDEEVEMTPDEIIEFLEVELEKHQKLEDAMRSVSDKVKINVIIMLLVSPSVIVLTQHGGM